MGSLLNKDERAIMRGKNKTLKNWHQYIPVLFSSIKHEKPPSISSSDSMIKLHCFSCTVDYHLKWIMKQTFQIIDYPTKRLVIHTISSIRFFRFLSLYQI